MRKKEIDASQNIACRAWSISQSISLQLGFRAKTCCLVSVESAVFVLKIYRYFLSKRLLAKFH